MSSSPTETPAPMGGNAGAVSLAKPPAARAPLFSAEAWSPLKVELFRSLYIATSIAQIGTWVREAGGPWLMKLLTDGRHDQPAMVAKVLLFSNLPICLFSVLAGALADVLDRRRLLIVTQVWMLVVSALLGVLTIAGWISPLGLLGLTFLVGTGTAAAGPALQALLPELVPRKDLPLAINLNSVALNVARALGPAMFIVVITFIHGRTGVGASFFLTALSFVWAIWVLGRWHRPPQRAAVHGEEMWGAIRSGFLYTAHSPANRAILLRVLTFIVPAVVMWAQVPIIATQQLGLLREVAEKGSAMLFAFVGLGAIFGVLIMPGLHARYKIDPVVNVCTLCFAAGLMILSRVHSLWLAAFIMVFLGINWVIIPTNFNTATQKSVPLWVKGRAISFYLTVLFGSFTIGAAIWGPLTTRTNISHSLFLGGFSMAVMLILAVWFPLTINEGLDLAAANATGPDIFPGIDPTSGPTPAPVASGAVDVVLDYDVDAARAQDFLNTMQSIRQQRRRSGASAWRLEPIPAQSLTGSMLRYREAFRFHSLAEFNRQPARMTNADLQLLNGVKPFLHSATDRPIRASLTVVPPTSQRSDSTATGAAPSNVAPLTARAWLLDRVATSFERTLDEIEIAVDRFGALRQRERHAPGNIRITIEFPSTRGRV